MLFANIAIVLLLIVAGAACVKIDPGTSQGTGITRADTPISGKPKPALDQIDLSRMVRITPNSRAQDPHNQIEVVDHLIAHGKESLPFLISKLDDDTKIDARVVDYWNPTAIGDVALFILSDFSVDSNHKETIPGASWDNVLERGSNRDISAVELFGRQVARHGRRGLRAKWEKIWTTYKDRIVWDDKERCFKVV